MTGALTTVTIPPCPIPAATVVGARTYLVDRIVPECEILTLPARGHGGGTLSYGRAPLESLPQPAPSGRLKRLKPRGTLALSDTAVFDLRRNAPENWAHFLTNHLPLVFHVSAELGLEPEALHLVTPAATPRYILDAAEFFGLRLTASDAQLAGAGVAYNMDPWTTVRATRADWVAAPAARAAFARGRAAQPSGPLPRRAYLSRKSARALENEDEICALLAQRGFERVFAETLSAADQIALFQEAEAIVAIHGAALGPLLWRQPESPLAQLVELMPCGHMTDYYRGMCAQLGVGWIGVRGRLKPEYVTPAYDFNAPFKAFSQDDFEVDPASLTHALDLAGL